MLRDSPNFVLVRGYRIMEITVGEMLDQLKVFPKDTTLYFGGLDFYRLKSRGDDLVQVEFDQPVYRDDTGRVIVDNITNVNER